MDQSVTFRKRVHRVRPPLVELSTNRNWLATHFLLGCSNQKKNLSLWRNLKLKITVSNQADGVNISRFIDDLDRHNKVLLLPVGRRLRLPFDNATNTLIIRFIAAAVQASKIHKLRLERLRELEAPWITEK